MAKKNSPAVKDDLGKRAIDKSTDLALKAMQGGSPFHRIVVYVCWGIILIGILTLLIPPYDAIKQGIAFCLVILALMILGVKALWKSANEPEKDKGEPVSKKDPISVNQNGQAHINKQGEPVPFTSNLPNSVYIALRTLLSEVREKFVNKLNFNSDHVRANIFLPSYSNVEDITKYILSIYPGLHHKMENVAELNIKFQSEQGVTGSVFQTGQDRVVLRLNGESGVWDETYQLTPDLEKTIHPDLNWIVSIAIKDVRERTIGVMNIDGLKDRPSIDELYNCLQDLMQNEDLTQKIMLISQFLTRFSIYHKQGVKNE